MRCETQTFLLHFAFFRCVLTLDVRRKLPLNGAALSRNMALFGHTVGGVLTSFCTIAQTKYQTGVAVNFGRKRWL